MTNGAVRLLSTLRAGAADSLEAAPDGPRRRGSRGFLLLNLGGWLFFGAAVMIGWLEQYRWHVVLAITPARSTTSRRRRPRT